ncbi:COX15/CtaA family protein [Virgibacillus litoralis]|uniref:Cytochrome c oxidase assembly protein subunit 15 n=1 Tax=Virgibacillus litoralis TaxID=578221 RepID=A0ABS4HJ41_9BACI|nr:COX15/CtaA family protein [Virgibacillus litoralis]MBP1950833.1 cytochrome c oxidase assembly protein subunit 15 [Virgibacillus litoralis]
MSKQKFVFITVLLTYLLIVFGGYVASSESGMGCGPEWPLCNGQIIPGLQGDTLIEFGHRVIGAILFFMTVIIFIKVRKENESMIKVKVVNWMLGLLILQLIMGAIVVFYHLPSIIITIHLLIAMITMAILIWFWRSNQPKNKIGSSLIKHLDLLSVLLFITIGLGAYIKHQHYGLSCGWLGCDDSVLPASLPEILQTSHRALAFIVTGYIIFLAVQIFKEHNHPLKKRMVVALVAVILQIIAGIATILSFVSLSMAVLHLAIGTLLFAVIVEARIMSRR